MALATYSQPVLNYQNGYKLWLCRLFDRLKRLKDVYPSREALAAHSSGATTDIVEVVTEYMLCDILFS